MDTKLKLKNESDIARKAMELLPVINDQDLVNKLSPYKTASVSMLRELIRKVNTENQYSALKTAEFNIDKAAESLCKPFDPDKIIQMMGKKDLGTLKTAVVTKLSFVTCRKAIYEKNVTRSKAKRAAIRLTVALKRAKDELSTGKVSKLAMIAEAKRPGIFTGIKQVNRQIADLLGRDPILDRKYAGSLLGFRTKEALPIGLTADRIVKWAELNDRLQNYVKSLEVIDFILEK